MDTCRLRVQADNRYGLTAREVELAKKLLCRLVQREVFAAEFQQIQNGQNIARNSALLQLSPYIDKDGVLRVNGRIDAASWLPISSRHPIILPPKHYFARLVVMHYHKVMRHQNTEATICEIRRHYWIPQLRTLLRSVITHCLECRLRKVQPEPPQMAPLPIDRLTPYIRPFSYTGLDYFGPIAVTIRRSTEKRWVALFTCLTVRAVHLELAHDLSTDSCIDALRNFMNRRGVPIRLRSDNGKNFVGTEREAKRFREVFDCSRIQDELTSKGVEWIFNSPFNPSEGGVWERLVQCVKRVLRQTLKETAPKEHTLNCFLIEAENIVNSRPLTHLSISVDQEQPLTPNNFLLGEPNDAHTPTAESVLEKVCVTSAMENCPPVEEPLLEAVDSRIFANIDPASQVVSTSEAYTRRGPSFYMRP
ncbi:uncharacterized protein LOC118757372 [Rhagoletis pomonella]|uniref:uncharacterized protein LOC118757372 n=1 Tax=Rhagoletis pomonella TaxID=28610 RepID=UPI00177F1A42|nr:uncharacterized protein LOC118757372 [Rhagoletis pomonella]